MHGHVKEIFFKVREEQMILSHTPLKMFDWLHNKHVLVSGQGRVKEILQEYPFTKHLWHGAKDLLSWKINKVNISVLKINKKFYYVSNADQGSIIPIPLYFLVKPLIFRNKDELN